MGVHKKSLENATTHPNCGFQRSHCPTSNQAYMCYVTGKFSGNIDRPVLWQRHENGDTNSIRRIGATYSESFFSNLKTSDNQFKAHSCKPQPCVCHGCDHRCCTVIEVFKQYRLSMCWINDSSDRCTRSKLTDVGPSQNLQQQCSATGAESSEHCHPICVRSIGNCGGAIEPGVNDFPPL